MTNMNQKEIYNFLTSGTMTAKISSASLRGKPHVAPVWFVVDGKSNQDVSNIIIVFTTWSKSLKARNLLLNPQVSLCIDDQTPPYSFVIVNGIAEIDQSPDE
ncbi:pyridoxamine 5'-phosphate oxidase family protein [Candidatus Nitrosocosmicus franklandus]|uniref:Pyridoxamine 5'-phosphate oxidase n=1 Tax=Candidatus Nitrosocosmicus franklandianus TaxID=1798806 RepID=A0A484I983_9ARCH